MIFPKQLFNLKANRIAVVYFLVLISFSGISQPVPDEGYQWKKVENLSDEFDSWDDAKWWKPLWNYGVPVQMLDENSGVNEGNLWIRASDIENEERWFGTSRVMSFEQISYPMYTECSMKSAHMSAYNTFWLNNGDINNRDEIDVCENNSKPRLSGNEDWPYLMQSQYFLTVNGNDDRAKGNFDNRNLSEENPLRGVPWNEAYHTLGVYWIDDQNIQFYLDGEPAGKVTTVRKFTRDLNIIWDLWTVDEPWSGGLAQREDVNNSSNNTMYVDWIHTYKLEAPVTGIETPGEIKAGVGQERIIQLDVFPKFATNKTVTWTTEDPTIATVDQTGTLTGISEGTTTVMAVSEDGGFRSETVTVIQKDIVEVPAEGIEIVGEEAEVLHRESIKLESKILPSDATEKEVIWSSNNSNIASVDEGGNIFGASPGEAVITAKNKAGSISDSRMITVKSIEVEDISIVNPIDSLAMGDSYQFYVQVVPFDASDTTVSWRTSNKSIATVDDDGVIEAVGLGKTKLLAVSNDNGLSSQIDVEVVEGRILRLKSKDDIRLYPNPAVDRLFISGTSNKQYLISIFDSSGKEVYSNKIRFDDRHSLDVSSLSSGNYTLIISSNEDRKTFNFIKQ